MNDDNILHTTTTTFTYDEYIRFSDRACRAKNILSYILCLAIGGALTALALFRKNYFHALLVFLACISLVMRGKKTRRKKQEEEFNAPDSAGNCIFTYEFYSTFFRQTCDGIVSELRYYDLWKIIETDTNFYLIYARKEGCIIVKKNCSPELIRFLHNMKEDAQSPFYKENSKAELSYNKTTLKIMKRIGCPCEVLPCHELSAEEIMDSYHKAMETAGRDGYPVLVPSDDIYLEQFEIMKEDGYDREKLLSENLPDGKTFLDKRYRETLEDLAESGEDTSQYEEIFQPGDEVDEYEALRSFGNEYEEYILFRIPVDEPWKIPAYVPFEIWNADLEIDKILSVCRYWHKKYGAVPAVISHDTMEFLVEKNVPTEKDTWDLAREHAAFCEDRLDQCTGTGTLGELADSIRKSSAWYFWWD